MGMMRRLITTGSPFEKQAGYSRAVVDGDWIFVSGTTGYDYSTMTMPEDVETQARNAFRTIERILADADVSLADIVRAPYIVTRRDDVEHVFKVTGEFFEDIRPAATLLIAGLLREEMKVEIEVTARRRK
jgi:enamine deaminase RidA (YjgF/YER057c/UK114 family)